MSIKVIIADDHAVVRDGIKAVVERIGKDIKVIGEAANGNEVLEMAGEKRADVYVIDIAMPILNGIETVDRLVKMEPGNRVIILSMHDNRTFVEKALKCGAKGYILKENASEEIVRAIHDVHMGGFFVSPKISRFIINGFFGKRGHYKQYHEVVDLTRRERQILQLIAEGWTGREIAGQLNLSLNTVHVHRKNIMRKLDIHKQAELIRYALKEGISQP